MIILRVTEGQAWPPVTCDSRGSVPPCVTYMRFHELQVFVYDN